MLRRCIVFVAFALVAVFASTERAPAYSTPFSQLGFDVRRLAMHLPAPSALEIVDLNTGYHTGFNAKASMPAASTIKIPVMVDVFQQLATGRFDLQRHVTLLARDKDWGSGELCDAPVGSTYTISELLEKMIDISDNTATNMLIRFVGRQRINASMRELGLEQTRLTDDVRTDGWSIRRELRTSPNDLAHLLTLMARRELVDEWSSNEMISILEADEYNTLLPEPLPDDVAIAHKTGSLFDTLNDAGIVFAGNSPYVIAVMTTSLPSQDLGRSFIHTVSRLAYTDELRFAHWREAMGFTPTFAMETPGTEHASAPANTTMSPDLRYWSSSPSSSGSGGN